MQLSDVDKVKQGVSKIIENNKYADLFNKTFLRPIQIELKTGKTENQKSKLDALPYGIKQVLKKNISQNTSTLADFQAFDDLPQSSKKNLDFIVGHNYDNLISLIKPSKGSRLKLAICVCMYSQDKTMLRRTLAGICNNIITFVKNGYSPDDIGIFFIMDGIEVLDETVVDFFAEMEKQNFIYLDEDVEPSKQTDFMDEEKIQEDLKEDVLNVNHFIFDQKQWDDRQDRRLVQRKKQYHYIKNLIKDIEKLENDKKITYYSLNEECKKNFMKAVKEDYQSKFAQDDEQIRNRPQSFYAGIYAQKKFFIDKAMNLTKQQCFKYLESRENKALLNSYRYEINLSQFNEPEDENKNRHKYEQVVEEERTTKVNLFMVTKYVNRGKLSSHNWFFNGFCKELKPVYAVLLDVGLAPEKDALYKMIQAMEVDTGVGGVCGYMGLRIERLEDSDILRDEEIDCFSNLFLKFVDIQRAQQMEYHFAHLIDKPFQAMFKFIHVLPGAFSAYRMEAIQPGQQDSKLLKKYFKSISDAALSKQIKQSQFSTCEAISRVILPDFLYYCFFPSREENSQEQLLYDQNVYLAEDRTLCMGIYQNNYTLTYIPDAYAWVDPMKTLHGLLGQRKRWINGSFFAFEQVRKTLSESSQTHCCLQLQMLYLAFMNGLAFISPALFLFTVHVGMVLITSQFLAKFNSAIIPIFTGQFLNSIVYTVDFIYVMLYLGFIFYSMHLTNKNKKFVPYIYATSTLLGILSLAIFIILGIDTIRGLIPCSDDQATCPQNSFLITNPEFVNQVGFDAIQSLRIVILVTMGIYVIPIVIYVIIFCKGSFLVDIIFSTFSFMFYGPTYLNILNIYSISRIDDISWGTKGLDTTVSNQEKSRKENWKKIKLLHVSKYLLWNSIVAFILMTLANDYTPRFILTYIIMVILSGTLLIKVLVGLMFTLHYRCTNQNEPKNDSIIRDSSKIQEFFGGVKGDLKRQIEDRIQYIGVTCQQKHMKIGKLLTSQNVGSKLHVLGKKRAIQRQKITYKNKLQSSIQQSNIKKTHKPRVVGQQKQKVKKQKFPKQPKINVPNQNGRMEDEMTEGESPTKPLNPSLQSYEKLNPKKEGTIQMVPLGGTKNEKKKESKFAGKSKIKNQKKEELDETEQKLKKKLSKVQEEAEEGNRSP